MADTAYPKDWETTAILKDGSTVSLRPIRPDDRERLRAFHERQSPESIYLRFFSHRPHLSDRDLEYFTNVDYERRMAFVALLGDDLVAVARYETLRDQNVAEIAFFVDDGYHGRGLATLMLEYLAAAGRRRGLDGFTASVLPENYGMLGVFRKAGFEVTTGFDDGAIAVELGIDVTDEATAAIAARERQAQAQSVARLLEPRSVAVIGASHRENSTGHRLLSHLLDAPFAGEVQVVNPSGGTVAGVSAVRSVDELISPVDLAIVVTPADTVSGIVEACASKGVGGLLVVSAGFSETGPEGLEVESRLVETVRDNGLRLVGPNAFGVANTNPAINLQALFLPVEVEPGAVGLLSQSGPLGAALLGEFSKAGVGVSSFAAVGNRADVSVNDLLQYWASDERTEAIALYLENVGNVAKFTRFAKAISPTKPIVTVAPIEAELCELLRQSGVILVDEVEHLAEQSSLAVTQPVPRGRRVVVVSNASSVARLATTACRAAGLDLVTPALVGDTDNLLVDQQADPADYERMVVQAAVSAEVDAVFLALVPTFKLPLAELSELLTRVDRAVDKPMVATGLGGMPQRRDAGLPVFDFPERAAKALGRWAEHGEWRRRERGASIVMKNETEIRAAVDSLLGSSQNVVTRPDVAFELLGTLGIDHAPSRSASTVEDAVSAASTLGYPVALKAGGISDRVAGESGGTALDLQDEPQLEAVFRRMAARFTTFLPAVVQPMVPTGPHLKIEVIQDTDTGARLSIGQGGHGSGGLPPEAVQVLPAGAIEIADLTDNGWLAELVAQVGCREALNNLLVALAGAAGICPEIHRLVLNPVLLSRKRAVVVEVDIELRRVHQSPLVELRHL